MNNRAASFIMLITIFSLSIPAISTTTVSVNSLYNEIRYSSVGDHPLLIYDISYLVSSDVVDQNSFYNFYNGNWTDITLTCSDSSEVLYTAHSYYVYLDCFDTIVQFNESDDEIKHKVVYDNEFLPEMRVFDFEYITHYTYGIVGILNNGSATYIEYQASDEQAYSILSQVILPDYPVFQRELSIIPGISDHILLGSDLKYQLNMSQLQWVETSSHAQFSSQIVHTSELVDNRYAMLQNESGYIDVKQPEVGMIQFPDNMINYQYNNSGFYYLLDSLDDSDNLTISHDGMEVASYELPSSGSNPYLQITSDSYWIIFEQVFHQDDDGTNYKTSFATSFDNPNKWSEPEMTLSPDQLPDASQFGGIAFISIPRIIGTLIILLIILVILLRIYRRDS